MFRDLKYAVRTLLKNPGFALVAVIAIALGIGANTAIFSLINVALLKPIPVERPEQLTYVFSGREGSPIGVSSYPDFVDLKAQNSVFSDMMTFSSILIRMTTGEETEVITGAIVSGNYFDVLGVKPAVGRSFLPEEDSTPMSHPVAMLQHGFWTQRFGADPRIVGQTLMLDGRPFTIVGVTPRGFNSIDVRNDHKIYIPAMMQELVRPPSGGFAGGDAKLLDKRGPRWLTMVGRLKPGVTQEQAQANVSAIASSLAETYPNTNNGVLANIRPAGKGRPDVRQSMVPIASLLMAVVGAVLLIACANVANLMLARFSARRREIAVRLSLGASRWRLLRQVLCESLMISVAGGVAGLFIGIWSIHLLLASGGIQALIPVQVEVALDGRVLGFTLALSILTGVLFGLIPALRSLGFEVAGDLKNETAAVKHGRLFGLRNALVVAQMAISIVLLIGAGLFLRSFLAAQLVDLGVDTDKLITVPMNVNLLRYTRQQSTDFYHNAVERVEALPGVESASIARVLMLSGSNRSYGYYPEGSEIGPNDQGRPVSANVVGLNFFKTLGIPLLRGRDFTELDRDNTPQFVIVNEAMAATAWPGQDAVGKTLRLSRTQPAAEVIGVVRDAKYINLQEPNRPFIYLSVWQSFETGMTLHVRVKSNPESMLGPIRAAIQGIDKNLPVSDVRTMSQNASVSLLPERLILVLVGVFAGLALLLAAIGAYGVISYSVTQRTKEIGIRMALGARRRDVIALIIRQGMTLALAGIVIGVGVAFGLTRLLDSMLFGVSPTDPLTFSGVGVILSLVAAIASYVPARRAATVDPVIAVRQE